MDFILYFLSPEKGVKVFSFHGHTSFSKPRNLSNPNILLKKVLKDAAPPMASESVLPIYGSSLSDISWLWTLLLGGTVAVTALIIGQRLQQRGLMKVYYKH